MRWQREGSGSREHGWYRSPPCRSHASRVWGLLRAPAKLLAHLPFMEGPMLPTEKSKPMESPFDLLMSVLPFCSGRCAVPSCQERGAGLTGAGKAWRDGVMSLQSDTDCLDVSLSCLLKMLPCSEGDPESWVSGAEHVFRGEADGRCNSKQSYPCFSDLHYNWRMVSDLPLARCPFSLASLVRLIYSPSLGSFLNIYPSDQSYDRSVAM